MAVAIFYVLGLVVAGTAALLSSGPHTTQEMAQTMLHYFLPVGVGLPLVFAFFGHVFQSDLAARRLGWPAGSPFQKEVGFWDGAAGIAAIMCFWKSGDFWLATILINAIFWTLAGGLHTWEVIREKNYHADNVATSVVDFLVPITLIVLYLLAA